MIRRIAGIAFHWSAIVKHLPTSLCERRKARSNSEVLRSIAHDYLFPLVMLRRFLDGHAPVSRQALAMTDGHGIVGDAAFGVPDNKGPRFSAALINAVIAG